jgi:hypothetical protein
MSVMSAPISALNTAITADLNHIQQYGNPDSWDTIDNAIARNFWRGVLIQILPLNAPDLPQPRGAHA